MKVRKVEDQIRYLDHEMAFVWESEGHFIFKKEGSEHEVNFTEDELLSMKNGILTHNHPFAMKFPETDPRSFGHSFSEDDIRLACRAELSEIRAVTRKLRFSMKPSLSGVLSILVLLHRWRRMFVSCMKLGFGFQKS